MPDTDSVAVDQPASPDLINFLKAIEVGAFYWTVPAPDIVNPGRSLPSRGALPAVVPAAGGGARDPQWAGLIQSLNKVRGWGCRGAIARSAVLSGDD